MRVVEYIKELSVGFEVFNDFYKRNETPISEDRCNQA